MIIETLTRAIIKYLSEDEYDTILCRDTWKIKAVSKKTNYSYTISEHELYSFHRFLCHGFYDIRYITNLRNAIRVGASYNGWVWDTTKKDMKSIMKNMDKQYSRYWMYQKAETLSEFLEMANSEIKKERRRITNEFNKLNPLLKKLLWDDIEERFNMSDLYIREYRKHKKIRH